MEDAEELFNKYHGDPLLLQMAAYLLSLQLERNRNQDTKNEVSELYLTEPLHVIKHVLQSTDNNATAPETDLPESNDRLVKSLRKYLLVLADFVQAKTLEDLGKGSSFNILFSAYKKWRLKSLLNSRFATLIKMRFNVG